MVLEHPPSQIRNTEERAMGICREIRTYSNHHEWVGDFFSLIAVTLLFGTVGISLWYYQEIAAWIGENVVFHGALLAGALAADILLIVAFLAIGSARAGEESESCFGTFQGRRGGASPIDAFRSWLHHMEHVGKKHR